MTRPPASPRSRIVLTGASGVVGRAILSELRGRDVLALVHGGAVDGTPALRCDVSRRDLGLDAGAYRDLARDASCIIHCAAVTDWVAPEETLQAVNVAGTQHVTELARRADVPLYHVSTAFVRALADDAPLRLPRSHVIAGYVRSKIAAEAVVRDSGVAHTILRPTNLVGDSRTGEIARMQIVQLVSGLVCRGRVPVFPVRPGALIDVLAQDAVARAITTIVDAGDIGREYWLTAGTDAMTAEETVEICTAFARRLGRPIEPPALLNPDAVDIDSPAIQSRLSPIARGYFGRLREFSDGLTACGTFPSSTQELSDRYGLPAPGVRSAYLRGLEYWAAQKGLLANAGRGAA
jgi:nucleoside-diphosphate-sugar epimerase